MGVVQVGIFGTRKNLVFKSDSLYYEALKDAIVEGGKILFANGNPASPSHQLGKNSNLFIFRTERKDAYHQNAQ